MKRLLLCLSFGITVFLSFPIQPAFADPKCPQDKYYQDTRKSGGGCIYKHGGYYEPSNQCADSTDGCVYAYTIVPYDTPGCPGSNTTNPSITPNPIEKVIGIINPPAAVSRLGFGAEGLSSFFNTAIQLIYIVGGILFIFMVIISALQWIMSGGDKEAVAGARNRLTFAIIGIVILALAFVLINVLGQITGFEFFAKQSPPGNCDIVP